MLKKTWVGSLLFLGLFGCGGASGPSGDTQNTASSPEGASELLDDPIVLAVNAEDGMAELGTIENEATTLPFNLKGDTAAARVRLTPVLTKGLNRPSSLAFKPKEGSLWISNRGDDSTVVIDNVGTTDQKAQRFTDDSAHFMNNPTQLAFSATLTEFAASLESENDYNGQAAPNMFTGPTLFTSDRRDFEGGTMSHLDMLHHSPLSMGISIGARPDQGYSDLREYWVFNGQVGAIDRYFFRRPHELGGDDHSDGITVRYGNQQLRRVPSVPGHLAFDASTKQLYIADTGNGRIVRLDTRTALNSARRIAAWHNETPLYASPEAKFTPLTTSSSGLVAPSGLILYKGFLVVTDNATGHIKFFTSSGTLRATVDTGLGKGALAGLAVSPTTNQLYLVDMKQNRVLQFEAY